MKGNHIWKFFRAGGFDQVRLESGADLAVLDQLDQKLWVALACPKQLSTIEARRLQLAAEHGGGIGLLLRPKSAASTPYAAATRWLVPSWCCRPSPPSVVLPEVAPSKKPRAR